MTTYNFLFKFEITRVKNRFFITDLATRRILNLNALTKVAAAQPKQSLKCYSNLAQSGATVNSMRVRVMYS